MTIDEAIKHAEEVAEEHERHLKVYENMDEDRPLFREEENECKDCAEEHRQLAGWLKELKQLREQEPCEDCVSRKAVIDTIFEQGSAEKLEIDFAKLLLLQRAIITLPPVTPIRIETVTDFADRCRECGKQKTKWIPVSEKLPEEDGDYLLWGKIDEDEDEYTFIGSYDSGCEEFGIWQEQFDRTTLGCLGSDFFEYASVIAWKPLPEPYKEESEE